MASSIIERLDTALVDNSADGLFRCDRAIFTDAGFFELEMEHLFEGNWMYLALPWLDIQQFRKVAEGEGF